MQVAIIQAIESHLPERRLGNAELSELYPGWSAEKILQKTGIAERAVAGEHECASDLAVAASERLIERTGISRDRIDLLMLCTQSPDYVLPTTACLIQDRLGLSTSTAAFDFNLGCSGYPYGLAMAKGLLESGTATCALLLMAETYTKYIHPMDKSVRTLFGDAASATLISLGDRELSSLGPFVLGTDGSGSANLIVPMGGARRPHDGRPLPQHVDDSGNIRTDANLFMNGPAILEFTMRRIPSVVQALLDRAGLAMQDVDQFVFHQASEFMLRYLQRKLAIPDEKFTVALSTCGNTVSSTIPIALQAQVQAGRVRRGDLLMLVGFGVGYSWGAGLVRWQPDE